MVSHKPSETDQSTPSASSAHWNQSTGTAKPNGSKKPLDIVFLQDTTGSQGPYIKAARSAIRDICDKISATGKLSKELIRFGLIAFRDHPPQEITYVTKNFGFTFDIGVMQQNLTRLVASGGGDGPEAQTAALADALNMEWTDDGIKMVILITDSPPHGLGEDRDGFSKSPDQNDPLEIARQMAERGITLASTFVIACEPCLSSYKYALDFYIALTQITGGRVFPLLQADKLGDYIVGTAVETIETEQLIEEFEQVIVNDVYIKAMPLAVVTENLQYYINSKGVKINTIKVEDMYIQNEVARENQTFWVSANIVADARGLVREVHEPRIHSQYPIDNDSDEEERGDIYALEAPPLALALPPIQSEDIINSGPYEEERRDIYAPEAPSLTLALLPAHLEDIIDNDSDEEERGDIYALEAPPLALALPPIHSEDIIDISLYEEERKDIRALEAPPLALALPPIHSEDIIDISLYEEERKDIYALEAPPLALALPPIHSEDIIDIGLYEEERKDICALEAPPLALALPPIHSEDIIDIGLYEEERKDIRALEAPPLALVLPPIHSEDIIDIGLYEEERKDIRALEAPPLVLAPPPAPALPVYMRTRASKPRPKDRVPAQTQLVSMESQQVSQIQVERVVMQSIARNSKVTASGMVSKEGGQVVSFAREELFPTTPAENSSKVMASGMVSKEGDQVASFTREEPSPTLAENNSKVMASGMVSKEGGQVVSFTREEPSF